MTTINNQIFKTTGEDDDEVEFVAAATKRQLP